MHNEDIIYALKHFYWAYVHASHHPRTNELGILVKAAQQAKSPGLLAGVAEELELILGLDGDSLDEDLVEAMEAVAEAINNS